MRSAPSTLERSQSLEISLEAVGSPVPGARPVRRLTAGVAAAGVFVGLVALLYYASTRTLRADSDAASTMLQGISMSHGNLGLQGWRLSLDSFWLSDTVVFALLVTLFGVKYQLMYLMPAVVAVVLVFLGMYLASAHRRRGAALAGALTVFALIGLPSSFLANKLLQSPVHVVTALWCLLSFMCLRRLRFDWYFVVGVILLAAATVSDLIGLAIGILPVFLAGLVAVARSRSIRVGVVPAAAAAAGALTALALRTLAGAGGWLEMTSRQRTATMLQALKNVPLAFHYAVDMFGMGQSQQARGHVPVPLQLAHLTAATVGVAVLVGVGRLARGVTHGERLPASRAGSGLATTGAPGAQDNFLDDVLLLATLGSLCSFLGLTVLSVPPEARYLLPAAIFASVLTGRFVASLAERVRPSLTRKALQGASIATVLAFAAGTGYQLSGRVPATPYPAIARFLAAHHLQSGLADYWTSAIVTIDSDDRVLVRPVGAVDGRIYPLVRDNSDVDWYRGVPFRYLVYAPGAMFRGVNKRAAERTWGHPASVFRVAGYRILVWARPFYFPKGLFPPGRSKSLL
ncbi:MAG TPA: hypothetical protein VME20_00185 [Acidimicrobiales bacterium]|nr:hypothetical protein [Acidimicrobiales bacterium]